MKLETTMFSIGEAVRPAMAGAITLAERWRSGVAYNPLSDRIVQDPYPLYAALRTRSPVHRSTLLNGWLFTRHADVDAILRDHRRFANDPRKGTLSPRQRALLPPAEEYTLLIIDPPDHARLRALVNRAFTQRAVRVLEPRIRAILGEMLDDIADPGAFDFMRAVARPLPVVAIAEMLGVPAEDRDRFSVWSALRARMLEPTITQRERAAGVEAGRAFDAWFRPILEQRAATPRDDIVSALVQARDEDGCLSERETLNMLRLLVVAGNETIANLIGNGMLALLRNPGQFQRLRDDPGLIPAAVDELLRFDSPVQTDFRRVLADCEVNGFTLRARDNVILSLGAANRDPGAFDDPDHLDVGRGQGSHLAFGRGIHHCLGAALARLEGRIAFEMLLERFPRIELLDERPRFRNGIVLRGLKSLAVRCTSA
ncbi:MAG: cytochrome P450 [Rhodobacteraceae bacterium]|nr:cytochrome P450 [Paracoccaceae bacterium]